jgi:hypothetical protein
VSDYISSNIDGLVRLYVSTRFEGYESYVNGYQFFTTLRTIYVYVNWGDGTTSGYSGDPNVGDGGFSSGWFTCTHQYNSRGPFTITGFERYRRYGTYGLTSERHFTLYAVDGKWIRWHTDCGDTAWDANGVGCSWNGNYGICWHTNGFNLSIKEVYNTIKFFGWAFNILGMTIDALFTMWFGDGWYNEIIANYGMPWTSNWSYWHANQQSWYPWDWWWTNWAPGFSGPGRIGFDIAGVFHTKDDPLNQFDICSRNAGSADMQPGFVANRTVVTVGNPVQFTDQSFGVSKMFYGFGDGNNSSLRNPMHVYIKPGVYSVSQMCYYRDDVPVIPVIYTRERYIIVVEPSQRLNCSFTPVPSSWTLQTAMNATFIYASVGEAITIYFDKTCEADQVMFYPGYQGSYKSSTAIYSEKPGLLENWTITISYPGEGWVYPYAIFSQKENTKAGSYQFTAGIKIGNPTEKPDVVNPESEIEGPDYPTPPPAHMHRYVRLSGSDWNDGLTWETAMKTWDKALSSIPEGGWLHVDYDDYRHQAPIVFDKSIVIIPHEDYREIGLYNSVILPGHGKKKWLPW